MCSLRYWPMLVSIKWTRLAAQALCGSLQACNNLLKNALPLSPAGMPCRRGIFIVQWRSQAVFSPVTQHKKAAFRANQHKKRFFIVLFQEQRALRKVIPADPLRSPGCARRSGHHHCLPAHPAACPSASTGRGRSGGWWSWAPWPDRRRGSRSPSPPWP